MPVFARKATIGLVAALLLLAACQNASNSPSASSGANPSEAAVSSPVATVPTDQLAFAGILTTCIDIPYPPQELDRKSVV